MSACPIWCTPLLIRTARIGRRDVLKEKDLKKGVEAPPTPTTSSRRRSSSSATEDADQYGLSQLFQPDNAPRGVMATVPEEGGIKMEDTSIRTKFKVAPMQDTGDWDENIVFGVKYIVLGMKLSSCSQCCVFLCVPIVMKICLKRSQLSLLMQLVR